MPDYSSGIVSFEVSPHTSNVSTFEVSPHTSDTSTIKTFDPDEPFAGYGSLVYGGSRYGGSEIYFGVDELLALLKKTEDGVVRTSGGVVETEVKTG